MGRLSLMSVLVHPHGTGQAVAIWLSDDPDRRVPTALRRWLEHPVARHPDDPLFVGLRALGPRRRYSGHSLRAGFATAAARAQLHDVMRQPRHKSEGRPPLHAPRRLCGAATTPRRSCAIEPEYEAVSSAAQAKLKPRRKRDAPFRDGVRQVTLVGWLIDWRIRGLTIPMCYKDGA